MPFDFGTGAAVILGIDAGKNFTRRYDHKQEYVVRGKKVCYNDIFIGGEFPECKRSYLGETMPHAALPDDAYHVGPATIDGRPMDHWWELVVLLYAP